VHLFRSGVNGHVYQVNVPSNIIKRKKEYFLLLEGSLVSKSSSLEYVLLLYQLYSKYGIKIVLILTGRVGGGMQDSLQNIYKTKSNTYIIQKQINNKKYYYGTYKTLEDAITIRNELLQNNWDNTKIKREGKRVLPKHIYSYGSKYMILKDNESYGIYTKLDEAVTERDLLIQHNWDYNFIDLL